MTTHKVTLRPSNEIVEVDSETNLLQALREQNIYIKSSCGGVASCSDCICKIVTGEDNLESPPFAELKLLGNVFHITRERLLCQTKIRGDVTIDISRHDKATDEEKLKAKTTKNAPKKPTTKVRSKDDFDKIKEERFKEKTERQSKDKDWEKFWEKNPDGHVKKGLGGGKRPKFFDTDKAQAQTEEELKKRAEKMNAPKKEYASERFKNYDKNYDDLKEANASSDDKNTDNTNKDFKKFRRD